MLRWFRSYESRHISHRPHYRDDVDPEVVFLIRKSLNAFGISVTLGIDPQKLDLESKFVFLYIFEDSNYLFKICSTACSMWMV